jgi:hypothetical protein
MAILDDYIAQAFGQQGSMQPSGILNQQQQMPQEAVPQAGLGFFDRVSRTPGAADAFLQMGAGLLSENKLGPALGKGFAGFSKGLLEGQIADRPKVTPLANGAFSQISYPDGRPPLIIPNEQVQKFLIEDAERKNTFSLNKIQATADAGVDASGRKLDQKTAAETRPMLDDVRSLKSRWTDALSMIGKQGTSAQLIGIPGVDTVAGFFGADEAANNKLLQGLTVDETLLNTAKTKGAISNAEMALFKSPIPKATDDREKVWKPWIEKRLEVLSKLEQFYQSEVARGETTRPSGGQAAPAANPAPMTVPGLSPAASKYFN